jgi:hypothetical protein
MVKAPAFSAEVDPAIFNSLLSLFLFRNEGNWAHEVNVMYVCGQLQPVDPC